MSTVDQLHNVYVTLHSFWEGGKWKSSTGNICSGPADGAIPVTRVVYVFDIFKSKDNSAFIYFLLVEMTDGSLRKLNYSSVRGSHHRYYFGEVINEGYVLWD